MSGGSLEYVMAVLLYDDGATTPMSGKNETSNSGFNGKLLNGDEYVNGGRFAKFKILQCL